MITLNIPAIKAMIEEGRHLVPPHMFPGVERYMLEGVAPGNFLSALLCNDLMDAMGRADDTNADAIRQWCQFLYNFAPANSYGSPEIFKAWLAQFLTAGDAS